ncbi:MAG: PilC/PilY family type IV pilus protein [Gammaproteobacteria bacterium]
MNNTTTLTKSLFITALVAAVASFLLTGVTGMVLAASPPPQVSISSTPLTVIVPSHPQVLIALTNSNSMDSSDDITDTSNSALTSNAPQSAIMTWSGNIGAAASDYLYGAGYASLESATSPLDYTVPTGFTPPITGGAAASSELYTAQVDQYSVSGDTDSGNSWTCDDDPATKVTALGGSYTAVPKPSGSPPSTALGSWPTSLYGTWSSVDNETWYYNGINTGGDYGFSTTSNPAAMLYRPSNERLASRVAIPYGISAVSPAAMLLGLSNVDYLVSDDGGSGGVQPRSTGGSPTPPPACGVGSVPYVACAPPVTDYCHEWKWTPLTVTPYTDTYTYYGDNSASRLNIAKSSIASVLSTYAGTTDFGLMDYSVPSKTGYYSWAYYMSPPGGFTFSKTYAAPTYNTSTTPETLISEDVVNPCYKSTSTTNTTCGDLVGELTAANPAITTAALLKTYEYMTVAARSDDPTINDVFLSTSATFTGTNSETFIEDGTITPASPYAGYSLSDYNSGNVQMTYSNLVPAKNAAPYNEMYTYPTNAGYVAYTPQVIYGARGYLWSGAASATTGNMLVNVSTAGTNPTTAQIAAYVATFTPYLVEENNVAAGDPNYSTYKSAIFASASQSPIAGMLSKALSSYGPAPAGPCPPPRYVILMTDGLPTLDLSGKTWPPLGSAAATGYGVTATFNGDGSLSTTNDQALTDTITELSALKTAGVKTFVVGMGPGVNPTLNPQAAAALTAMAVAGGTGSASPTGYFPGSSPAQVVTDLQNILDIISVSNVSSVSAAANTSSLNTGTTVYQASYSGYNGAYHDWTGDVQAFPVNASTGAVSTTASWSAQCELDAMATGAVCTDNSDAGTGTGSGWNLTRLIATWNPSTGAGVPLVWADISSAQQTELQPTDALGQDRLNYLRGDTVEESHNGGADAFRDRSHLLGDIVDSAPLYIGVSSGPYMADPTYQTFAAGTKSREAMIYVGANDGMLHAFDAGTGEEKFAFVPNGVFPNLINLTSSAYNLAHQFFVDGTPSAGDVKFANNTWHTLLVGGLNDGGQSIYALDVTSPSSIGNQTQLASSVLWEFTDSTLGLTYSQPVTAYTNVTSATNANPNGFLVFFGSGYNNSDGNDYLYAVNPQTGKEVAKINLCAEVAGACNATLANGLSSPVVINSGGAVGEPDDRVYTGDLQGNMWSVNISNSNPANWVVSLLYQARDPSNNPQPITVTPVVSLQPNFPGQTGVIVYFGTGQYLGLPDQTTTQVQSFYGVWDNGTGTATKSQLEQQVITDVAAGTATAGGTTTSVETRTITDNSVNWTTQRGWYMNLPDSGERAITNPRLYDGEVVFTTYVPSPGDTCVGGGAAFLMAVNYANGGSFPQPQLDINGDGTLNTDDQLASGLNPVGIGLGQVYASAPAILSASMGAIQVMKLITLSTGVIMNVGERGGMPGQRSWWQVQ